MRVVALDGFRSAWAESLIGEHFGSTLVVTRGRLHDVAKLPGLVAVEEERPLGVIYHRCGEDSCEVVAIAVSEPGHGVGRTLVTGLGDLAATQGCRRLWLVTTNDNLSAQRFYSALGFSLVAVHSGAVTQARALKPEIPVLGEAWVPQLTPANSPRLMGLSCEDERSCAETACI